MQYTRSRKYQQTLGASEYPSPSPIYITSGGGAIVVIANLALAGVIIWATWRDESAAALGIVGAVISFGVLTPVGLMALNGGIVECWRALLDHLTTRAMLRQPAAHNAPLWRVLDDDPMQTPHALPTPDLPVPTTSFVAPNAPGDEGTERAAIAWVAQLYGADGMPDPAKVLMASDREEPGRVRIAAPSRAAKEWLVERRILRKIDHGYRLNLARCPNAQAASAYLATTGAGGYPTPHPHPTHHNEAA